MSEEINVDEVIRTIQFSEIAQKGYKVMSNDEFDRIVNGILNLQQETQQLKEENKKLKQPTIFIDTQDMEERYGEGLYMDYLKEQNELYKSVLDEIREYIEHEWFKRGQLGIIDKSFQEWQLKDILQILDKVKEYERGTTKVS